METRRPQRACKTSVTLRVDTPWTYISARLKEVRSLCGNAFREPRDKNRYPPPNLRDVHANRTKRSMDSVWFKAFGVFFSGGSAFVRSRLESGSTLEEHRFIETGADNLRDRCRSCRFPTFSFVGFNCVFTETPKAKMPAPFLPFFAGLRIKCTVHRT